MNIGVSKEIKSNEYKISIMPAGVTELSSEVSDKDYAEAVAYLLVEAYKIFDISEMIVKVKEPIQREYELFKKNQMLFAYLHLEADKVQTKFLLEKGIRVFAYETLKIDRLLPWLESKSEVAERTAAQVAAGLGVDVVILDLNTQCLHDLSDVLPENITTRNSTKEAISKLLSECDIVIGALGIYQQRPVMISSLSVLDGMFYNSSIYAS